MQISAKQNTRKIQQIKIPKLFATILKLGSSRTTAKSSQIYRRSDIVKFCQKETAKIYFHSLMTTEISTTVWSHVLDMPKPNYDSSLWS